MVGYYVIKGDSPHLEDLEIAQFSKIEDAEKYLHDIENNEKHPNYQKFTNVYIEYKS